MGVFWVVSVFTCFLKVVYGGEWVYILLTLNVCYLEGYVESYL